MRDRFLFLLSPFRTHNLSSLICYRCVTQTRINKRAKVTSHLRIARFMQNTPKFFSWNTISMRKLSYETLFYCVENCKLQLPESRIQHGVESSSAVIHRSFVRSTDKYTPEFVYVYTTNHVKFDIRYDEHWTPKGDAVINWCLHIVNIKQPMRKTASLDSSSQLSQHVIFNGWQHFKLSWHCGFKLTRAYSHIIIFKIMNCFDWLE